jgi:integrase/recombinase XerC
MNIKDFLQHISIGKHYSQHTVTAYKNDLNSFFDFVRETFEISDVKQINRDIIRSWIVELIEAGKSNATINRKLSTLKSYFNFLLKKGMIKSNPVKNINSLKTPSRLPAFITKQKMELFYAQTGKSDNFSSLRDFLVIDLLYTTGMRLTEIINLRINNINLNENTLKVLGKRNKERIIPFSEREKEYIIRYKDMRKAAFETDNPYLIVTDKGNKTYPKFIYRIVEKNLSGLTQSKKSPHILRHTFATHMLNEGADLNTIKEILGHANLSATQVYTHNTIEQLKSIYNHAHPRARIKKEV